MHPPNRNQVFPQGSNKDREKNSWALFFDDIKEEDAKKMLIGGICYVVIGVILMGCEGGLIERGRGR